MVVLAMAHDQRVGRPFCFICSADAQSANSSRLLGNTVNVTEENSSSPETEQTIVESHSYGQQLGRVLDVVNELIAERPAGAPDVQSIQDFAKLWQSVEQIKVQSEVKRIEKAIADLASMKKQRSDEYQRLAIQLRAVLEE